jgi:hypothetical protein
MTADNDSSSDWVVSNTNVTRRRVAATVGSVVVGLGSVAVAGSDTARADVAVGDVAVSDASFEATSADPVLEATIPYEYSVENVSRLEIELLVGDSVVASESLRTDTTELSNSTTLTGRVVDADAWTLADFDAPVGETVSRDVTAGVRFRVMNDDSVAAEASADTTATVKVSNPNSGTARVGLQASFSNAEA